MKRKRESTEELLALIRDGKKMTLARQMRLTLLLSLPAMVAQLSSIIMQYIDAAMVGRLGADEAASIGLVATTTWLFGGVCSSVSTGFSVQVAHRTGAGDMAGARRVLRHALTATLLFGSLMAAIGLLISPKLPAWLGADPAIHRNATLYFSIFSLCLPILQLNSLAGGMLRCSGNMRVPGVMGVVMCLLDVLLNFLLIFPTRTLEVAGLSLVVPGAGLGVTGAALGTALALATVAAITLCYLCLRSPLLRLTHERGSFRPTRDTLRRALHIGLPLGVEHAVICGAQIMTTVIVAPLGVFAIAANSFAITAESLCYMPGYGIAEAATTLTGQSIGAGRLELARRFAHITIFTGMAVMGLAGVVMYLTAPQIMGLMTPVAEICSLGAAALRIEAFAEPMFAASIVAYGAFIGAADTLVPCLMNLVSIWAVRLPLALLLAPRWGLAGVWVAMCIELCFRGFIFLVRLRRGSWIKEKKTKQRNNRELCNR